MVADVAVTLLETTALIVGIVAGVVNVKFPEVEGPPVLAEVTAKS
jgi:hypothetical protein